MGEESPRGNGCWSAGRPRAGLFGACQVMNFYQPEFRDRNDESSDRVPSRWITLPRFIQQRIFIALSIFIFFRFFSPSLYLPQLSSLSFPLLSCLNFRTTNSNMSLTHGDARIYGNSDIKTSYYGLQTCRQVDRSLLDACKGYALRNSYLLSWLYLRIIADTTRLLRLQMIDNFLSVFSFLVYMHVYVFWELECNLSRAQVYTPLSLHRASNVECDYPTFDL